MNTDAVVSTSARRFQLPWWQVGFGVLSGLGGAAGVWMPLVTVPLVGAVGCFDYSRPNACACIAAASLTAIFSLLRRPWLTLGSACLFCAVLLKTGFDLWRWLHEALSMGADGGEMSAESAQMMRQMIVQIVPRIGAYALPTCAACCLAAGILAVITQRADARTTT